MLATEPLPTEVWDEIGWTAQTFSDCRHLIIYGQRTADNRFAFGGRGAPYHFGRRSGPTSTGSTVFVDLRRALGELIPADARRPHHPRVGRPARRAARLAPACGYDRDRGSLGRVGTSATACRPRTSPAAHSPTSSRAPTPSHASAVGQHRSPDWEPEPLRWLGHPALTGLARSADRVERRTGRPAKRIAVLEKILGA